MKENMAKILFVLGFAGSGKTKFSKKFIQTKIEEKEPWILLDKDIVAQPLTNALMIALGLDPNDRDSPEYKEKVRDLEYRACLDTALTNLKLGINVICPGPWTKELNNEDLFSTEKLGLPEDTQINHVFLETPVEKLKERIFTRNTVRDNWKKSNWETFEKTLIIPKKIEEKNILKINPLQDFNFNYNLVNKTINKKRKIRNLK